MANKKDKKEKEINKNYYLIDYENVHKTGVAGLENLNKNDKVIIFYSGNADKITFDLHQQILSSKANLDYFEVSAGGKNALDFQLSSYLGYLIGSKKKATYYIVSNDKGFEYIKDFWKRKGFKVEIISGITENPDPSSTLPIPQINNISQEDVKKAVQNLKLNKDKIIAIWKIIDDNIKIPNIPISKRKQMVNTELCKQFGNDDTKKIYAKIKPLFK